MDPIIPEVARVAQAAERFQEAQAVHTIAAGEPLPLSIRGLEAQAAMVADQAQQMTSQTRLLLSSVSPQHVQQALPFTVSLNLEYLRYQAERGEPVDQLHFLPMSRKLGEKPALYCAQIETESESEWFCQHGTALTMQEVDEELQLQEHWLLWKATMGTETLELCYYHPESGRLGVIRLREPHDLHCQVQRTYDERLPPSRKVYFDVSKDVRLGRVVRLLDWQEGLPLASATFYLDTTGIGVEDWLKDPEDVIQKLMDQRTPQK